MNTLRTLSLLIGFTLFLTFNTWGASIDPTEEINRLMTTLAGRGQFQGSILVAVNGRVIYQNGFGMANLALNRPFSPNTVSCIASVSKQFTAMTIMMLAERKKLIYDDPITRYIPELPSNCRPITIRHLLTHTSGIPDVGDLGVDHPALTNQEVLSTLIKRNDLVYKPGEQYQYSNTGYVLLSILVERVSGQPFVRFLDKTILQAVGMKDTFLYTSTPDQLENAAIGYSQYGGTTTYTTRTTGDGGLFSTVVDLFKWDQALYTEKLVSQSTLKEAFTPGKVTKGTTTYGFGWNSTPHQGSQLIWHTGNAGTYRAFIGRKPAEKITVIMLTNKGNSKRMEINTAILNILAQKPYSLPKAPISEKLYTVINRQGIQQALQFYDSLQVAKDTTYDFGEPELNGLGYQLLSERKVPEATQIFELNTKKYPTSSNAFDSLGEAYVVSRNKEMAIKTYEKALSLDPNNLHTKDMLTKLRSLK